MADYKSMYLTLAWETETAIRVLVDAQQQCEELYLRDAKTPILSLPQNTEKQKP